MSKSIRISDEAYRRLVAKAASEQRTVTAVVDRLLAVALRSVADSTVSNAKNVAVDEHGSFVVGVEALPRVPKLRPTAADIAEAVVAPLMTCPKCGCARSIHEGGDSKSRCERHPTCRWTP